MKKTLLSLTLLTALTVGSFAQLEAKRRGAPRRHGTQYKAPGIPGYKAPGTPEYEAPGAPEYEAPGVPQPDKKPEVPVVPKELMIVITSDVKDALGLKTKSVSVYDIITTAGEKPISQNSSKEDISSAFKKAQLRWHPDKAKVRGIEADIAGKVSRILNEARDKLFKNRGW